MSVSDSLIFYGRIASARSCRLVVRVMVLLSLGVAVAWLPAQPADYPSDPTYRTAKLTAAEQLILAFLNDSATALLEELALELKVAGAYDTEFGLWVRLRQAEALERDQRREPSIEMLLPIVDLAERKGYSAVYARANLTLALLHEQMERWADCRTDLNRAAHAVDRYGLDSLAAYLHIRTASFYRLREEPDSARYHAELALAFAERMGGKQDLAVSHVLLALLKCKQDAAAGLRHYLNANTYYRQLGDYMGQMAIHMNIARLYLRNGRPRTALRYNDSALVAHQRVLFGGSEDERYVFTGYRLRARIYRALGQPDSAWRYLNKGHDLELGYLRAANDDRVLEIESRYKDEKKALRLVEQAQQIESERQSRRRLFAVVLIIFLLLALMTYLYLRLRVTNRVTEVQARTIRETNAELSHSLEQQIMLRGEVHHRVKNNLQVIISLIELQKEEIEDAQTRRGLEAMSGRIYSMAAIHEILHRKEGTETVDLTEYVDNICAHFGKLTTGDNRPRFDIRIDAPAFNLETLMPLGILLNELLINSLKYATISGRQLAIQIRLQPIASGYRLHYRDNGPGFPEGKLRERAGGLGTYLLRSMVRQLRGRLKTYNAAGAVFEIYFKEKGVGDSYRQRAEETGV